jgi:Fe2+ or Zn2+ uptake regulation protein
MELLRSRGIQPSVQRLAVAEYVLKTHVHPSADQVWERARRKCPSISRATVYNTLNLLVEHGLLRTVGLAEGKVLFDANTGRHHHFIDDATGRLYDIPWEAFRVEQVDQLKEFEIAKYEVVIRGQRRAGRRRK